MAMVLPLPASVPSGELPSATQEKKSLSDVEAQDAESTPKAIEDEKDRAMMRESDEERNSKDATGMQHKESREHRSGEVPLSIPKGEVPPSEPNGEVPEPSGEVRTPLPSGDVPQPLPTQSNGEVLQPLLTQSNGATGFSMTVSITMRANFDLMQECAAADCDLASKTPEQALHALLTLLDSRIPPEDATLLGLVVDGSLCTKASVDEIVAAARACVAVHIRVDKRKRPDHNYNVHFACKCHGVQVGSCILKPHDNDPASFHQGIAVRMALGWRCIPLLHNRNIVDFENASVGSGLCTILNTWLKDDGWLSILALDE